MKSFKAQLSIKNPPPAQPAMQAPRLVQPMKFW